MKRRILSLEGQPRRPFVRSGFWEGADRNAAQYDLYFVGDAQSGTPSPGARSLVVSFPAVFSSVCSAHPDGRSSKVVLLPPYELKRKKRLTLLPSSMA